MSRLRFKCPGCGRPGRRSGSLASPQQCGALLVNTVCRHRTSASPDQNKEKDVSSKVHQITPTSDLHEVRVLRLKEVMKICGLARSSLYEMVNAGSFPQPIKLGGRASG